MHGDAPALFMQKVQVITCLSDQTTYSILSDEASSRWLQSSHSAFNHDSWLLYSVSPAVSGHNCLQEFLLLHEGKAVLPGLVFFIADINETLSFPRVHIVHPIHITRKNWIGIKWNHNVVQSSSRNCLLLI